MALTTTTASAAIGTGDTTILVASATSFAAGNLIQVEQEFMQILSTYSSGTVIPVRRMGINGSVVSAHPSGVNVTTGTASDFAAPASTVVTAYPISARARQVTSYSASGAITLPTPGTDAVAIINGTTGVDMTVAAPTKDMDGCMLYVASNGAATTTTVTFTGGLNGAGNSYDKDTFNTSAPCMVAVMAVNGLWMIAHAPGMGGTVTNLIGTIG